MLNKLPELNLFNQLPVSFWVSLGKKHNYRICFWSKGAEKIYGIRKDEAIGKSFIDLFVADDEDEKVKNQAKNDCDAVISGSFKHPVNCLAIDKNKNGQEIILLTNVFNYIYKGISYQAELAVDLTPSGFIKFLDDEYKEKRLGNDHEEERTLAAFIKHTHTVIERNRDQWSRAFAHEIRSELGSIKHSLEELSENNPRINLQNGFKDIERAQHSLYLFSQNFLFAEAFKRFSSTHEEVSLLELTFDLSDNLLKIVNRYSYWGEINNIDLHFSLSNSNSNILLLGSLNEFSNVIDNLISNAIKHADLDLSRDGKRSEINITSEVKNHFLIIRIKNRGQIAQYKFKNLFKPYYKDPNSPSEGLHLGLSIAKSWVDQVGGDITLGNSGDFHVEALLKWPIHKQTGNL